MQIGMLWGQGGTAGGLDRIYTDLVRALPACGVNVTGAVWGPDDVAALSSGRVHSFAPQSATTLQRYRGARRVIASLMREQHFDLVASHFALYSGLVYERLRRQPLVVHFHGPWHTEGAEEGTGRIGVRCKYQIEKAVYRRADRVIVLSLAFRDLIVSEFGIPADRVRLVPGHVDLERFGTTVTRSSARARLGWPNDRPILFSVRRLMRRMGLDRLVEAMRIVVERIPDALLYIGGKGPMKPLLEQQVDAAGLQNNVRLLGFIPDSDLPLAYRAADLNVVPTTLLEGFGLTAAEAIAAGTPSMVTPVGGLPEVVVPLSADLLFASTSPADIAAALTDVLLGRTRLPTQQECRAYAEARFSLPAAAKRTAAVYLEAMQ
ncbi:MAG TPA: glycosyltransferase family 4 protein [Rhodopila sp.]